jgi:hypothetical protein
MENAEPILRKTFKSPGSPCCETRDGQRLKRETRKGRKAFSFGEKEREPERSRKAQESHGSDLN